MPSNLKHFSIFPVLNTSSSIRTSHLCWLGRFLYVVLIKLFHGLWSRLACFCQLPWKNKSIFMKIEEMHAISQKLSKKKPDNCFPRHHPHAGITTGMWWLWEHFRSDFHHHVIAWWVAQIIVWFSPSCVCMMSWTDYSQIFIIMWLHDGLHII